MSAWISKWSDELSIRTHLWRVSNHYDHIHLDFWPRGYSVPPCADGSHRTQHSWGTVVNGDPGPENGLWDGDGTAPAPPSGGYEVDIHRNTIREGDRGDLPQIAQSLLARHGFHVPNTFDDNCQPDGIFGSGSDHATREFQASAGLDNDGVIGPITWSALEAV